VAEYDFNPFYRFSNKLIYSLVSHKMCISFVFALLNFIYFWQLENNTSTKLLCLEVKHKHHLNACYDKLNICCIVAY